MKNIVNLIIVFFSITLSISAQSLSASGVSDTDGVLIRWTPENPSKWNIGNEGGYSIMRKTIAYQDTPYTIEQLIDSKIALDSTLDVSSSSEFNLLGNDLAMAASQLIYDDTYKPVVSEHYSLADAVAYQDYIESKFLFSLMIADQSFDIAQAQALGYKDATALVDYTYQYTIKMNGDTTSSHATFTIKHGANVNLQAPQTLEGEGADSTANLSWEIKSTSHLYNLYNIQRSRDNVNFENVNEQAFTYISEAEDNPKYAYYNDKLPDNTTPYYYRIIGLSPFGIESLPSNTVMVTGIPAKLDISLTIDSLYEATEGNLRVDWASLPQSHNAVIDHFDIYTKASESADEIKLNTAPIAASMRHYDRVTAPSDAYYRLEAIDVNGHVYSTMSFAGQVVDKTPPSAPIGTSGKILRDGTVVLSWTANAELDLQGYKVFYSNVKNGEYSTTETEVNRDTFQIGNINTELDTDSIFYKVTAYDHRYNRSEYSEVISLERPDDVAPSSPVISQILARASGIRLSWNLSNTPDVSNYQLQRKTAEASDWTTILSFTPDQAPAELPLVQGEQFASRYIDEDFLAIRLYNYRLLASDNFDNVASSPIMTIKPYDNLIRGEIREFEADIETVQGSSNPIFNTLSTNAGGTYNASGTEITNVINSMVKLQWQYKIFDGGPLKEFKVYMQEVPPDMSPTDPILDQVPYILINTRKGIIAEAEALSQGFDGYMYVHDLSRIPGFKYNFKIMAYHTDGGFSRFSDVVVVPN